MSDMYEVRLARRRCLGEEETRFDYERFDGRSWVSVPELELTLGPELRADETAWTWVRAALGVHWRAMIVDREGPA